MATAFGAGALAAAVVLLLARRAGWAFAATALAVALFVATLFTGLYPNVLVSHPSSANSLTVTGAASAHYALSVITVVAGVMLPLVLLYQGWSYRVFRARLGATRVGSA